MAKLGDLSYQNRYGKPKKPSTQPTPATGYTVGPIPSAAPPAPSMLDDQYTANVAAQQFKNRNDIADYQTKITQSGEDYNTLLGRLAKSQTDSLYGANVAANKAGSFYGGQRNKARGEVDYNFGNQRQDATTSYNRNLGAWNTAIGQIREGEPLQIQQEAAASKGRVLAGLAANPPAVPDVARVSSGQTSPTGDVVKLASGWQIEYVNGKPSRFIPPGGN